MLELRRRWQRRAQAHTKDSGARLACHMQEAIAAAVGMQISHVSEFLEKTSQKYQAGDVELFTNGARLACYTQEDIAAAVGLDRGSIPEILEKMLGKYQREDSNIFTNFKPEVYTVWNFDHASRLAGGLQCHILSGARCNKGLTTFRKLFGRCCNGLCTAGRGATCSLRKTFPD